MIQTNCLSVPLVGTLLGQACPDDNEHPLPPGMTSRKGTSKECVCFVGKGGGRRSDLQANEVGQRGAGVDRQPAQPATYPRANTSDTAGSRE